MILSVMEGKKALTSPYISDIISSREAKNANRERHRDIAGVYSLNEFAETLRAIRKPKALLHRDFLGIPYAFRLRKRIEFSEKT